MRKIEITDVSLRDGIQSLLATRIRTEDMLDIVEILDKCGFTPWRFGVGPPLMCA